MNAFLPFFFFDKFEKKISLIKNTPHKILGDGVVRIYRNYSSSTSSELVTSWRALPEILPNNPRCGLVAEWQQSRGTLLVGGDVRSIRIWDATREITLGVSSTLYSSSSFFNNYYNIHYYIYNLHVCV